MFRKIRLHKRAILLTSLPSAIRKLSPLVLSSNFALYNGTLTAIKPSRRKPRTLINEGVDQMTISLSGTETLYSEQLLWIKERKKSEWET